MNIIELVKSIVEAFPDIDSLHVDYSEAVPNSGGISSTGDILLKEDILGNETRQHNFILYTVWQSQSDYDRMANSGTLLGLQYYLEKSVAGQKVSLSEGRTAELKKLNCSNGMLYQIPNQLMNGGVIYQLQIAAQYKTI